MLGLGFNTLAIDETRADTQLVGSKAQSLASGGFRNTANFEHDVAGAAYETIGFGWFFVA